MEARRGKRFVVALVSTAVAVAAGVGALAWSGRWPDASGGGGSVRLVDRGEELQALFTERSGLRPGPAQEAFGPPRLTPELAKLFYPVLDRDGFVFDPDAGFRRAANQHVVRNWPEHSAGRWTLETNGRGMRESDEPAAVQPALRVLVTGDSHTDGVCSSHESFANLLEARLAASVEGSVEVLNAGCGGYSLYNYAGVLEAHRDLDPDVFVVCVYGGNDFSETMPLEYYLGRRGRPLRASGAEVKALSAAPSSIGAQELVQALYFQRNPADVDLALETLERFGAWLSERCAELGIRPLLVYLPPPIAGQPELHSERFTETLAKLGLTLDDVDVSNRIADRWLESLAASGLEAIDLRPSFRSSAASLYWRRDSHIDLAAQRLIATALEERLRDAARAR